MFSTFKCILIFSLQVLDDTVFNQKKCHLMYIKYTNDAHELGIYERKVLCFFKL